MLTIDLQHMSLILMTLDKFMNGIEWINKSKVYVGGIDLGEKGFSSKILRLVFLKQVTIII
jgi:hypothetical protein